MAGDEPESLRKHRRFPDDGDEEDSKRRKHGHHRHHHHSSSSSRHKRHHRHRSSKHEHDNKHEEEDMMDPSLAIVASNSCSRPDDDKEEGEILEEDDYNGVDDGRVIKKKSDSDVEPGEIKPDGAIGVRSDNLDQEGFGKEREEFALNLNLSPEHNKRDNAQSSIISREDGNDDDVPRNSPMNDQSGNFNQVRGKVDVRRDSGDLHLVSGNKECEMGEMDGSSAEFESSRSREKKEKGRHDDSFSEGSTPTRINGVIGRESYREDKRVHTRSGSSLKGSGEEKNYRDAEARVSRHDRSRTPVTRENINSKKHGKTDECEANTISSRDVEKCDLAGYELKGNSERVDADRNGSANQEKPMPSDSMREKDKTMVRSSSHDRYHDDIHDRRSRSRDHGRERSRSRSVLQEEALVKKVHYHEPDDGVKPDDSHYRVKNDSDCEKLVRPSREDRHGSRDWVRDRERERSARYSRYSERVDMHGSREIWDTNREWREMERERDRVKNTDKDRYWNRDRDRDGDKERDRSRIRERDSKKDRDSERERDRGRDKETDMFSKHHKHDGFDYGYGSRDRYKDSRRLKHDETEYNRDRTRSKDPNKKNDSVEESKRKLKRDEDEQDDYQERIVLQLAEQEEEDLDRIKEESRKRRQAILEKYKQQQQHNEPPEELERETKSAELPCPSQAADNAFPDVVEGRNDGTDVYAADPSFSVGKSPPGNGNSAFEKTSGACGLGDGTPKSERSDDMFCDDIFGESPAGVRKPGKGDGFQIERSGLHDNWDDAEGYYSYRFGEVLDGRYVVTAAHGKGVFSTVVRAKDLKAGKGDLEEVAIKIIRNNDTMYKAGLEELIILKKLAGADPDDRRHCVRFLSSFKYRNHLCLVFESLHMNLREVLKKFGRNIGLKLTAVRAYAKQLFIALKHLRNCGVLHCDIKPDNMLVNEAKNVLKLCDFGNAMFAGKNEITPYLVSRFYRAPEIILGLTYDHPLDIWSVGCCLYELYSGKVLFPGPTNNDMLRLHMELKGPFPKKMIRKGAFTDHHFDQDLNFHATEEDPVTKKTMKRLLLNIKPKDISTLITGFPGEDSKMLVNFKDMLERIFVLDPEKRMTVSQALNHPFITGK